MIVSRLAGRASASLIDQTDGGAARFATGRVAAFHTAAAPGPMAAAQTPVLEPSHGYLEGSGVGSAFSNLQPSLALIQVMPLTGYYPQRDGPDGSSYGFQLGQVRTTAGSFSFAETNADGQLIPINQRTALFSILGVTYGGNGTTTFALPDLGGVLTVGAGNGPGLSNFELGEAFGSSTVNLTAAQMPSAAGGGGQGFGNAQESLALRWVIAVDGFFPTEDGGSGADADMMGMLSQWAGNFEPAGFMYADGRELQISQWPSLYAIIGTRYGGDGVTTFRIPDLQGRVAVGADSNSPVGTVTGAELTNLTTSQLPVGAGGSSLPVSNLQPTLAVTYLIVSDGIYPTRDSSAVPDLVYMGEVIAFAGDFVPAGYFAANGQVLPISQYQALFSLMGTTYGGDGITTFALPNLNDRAVIGTGYNPSLGNVYIGQTFGSDSVTLTTTNVVNVAPTILDLQTTDTGVEQVFDRLDQSVDIRDYNLDIRGYTGATLAIGRQGGANAQDAFRIDATGATFTVTGTDASGVLQSGGLTFATYVQSGGVLTITFTGSHTPATSALVDAVASSLSYANQSDAPPANVTLAYTFRDGNAGAQGAGGVGVHIGTTTVTLTAVDDAAVSRADAVTAAEGAIYSGNVFANNGSGADSDAEGDAFSVIAINGSGAGVGVQVTLPSGARLTLNANGTFDYDPNGAFAFVPGPASGASNLTFTDTFTYTLTGGATSTVTVTLNGADTNGDILVGTSGDDVLDGGVGNDTVDYSGAASGVKAQLNDAIAATDGSGGRDTLVNIENLTGSAFDDLLIGSNGANVLTGGLGADILLGLGGNDILIGGAGAANTLQGGLGDDIYVVDANDTVLEFAGEGTDSIRTSRVNYVLKNHFENLQYTGAASFRGTGNAANNVIEGGSGDDFLSGGGGIDRLDGNGGADTADYMNAAAGVVASLFDGAASNDGDGASDILSEIENLTGSAFNDSLTGDAAANLLIGGSGDDVLNGRGGNDILQGGLGVDTVSYVSAASGVTVRLDLNSASDGEGGTDTLNAIENATGSAFNDTLFGNGLANVLSGGLGFDLLFGLAGDDVLIGGSGAANQLQGGLGDDTYVVSANDTIFELVGEGTDTVQTDRAFYVLGANIENLTYTGSGAFNGAGNAAANVITGGAGDDTLTGGQGNDTLRGGGGLDYVVLAGVLADYTITDLGGGSYRIVDLVGGRDGTDVTTGIERVRFATGPTAALASLAVAPAPVLTDKAGSGPQVLPDLADDDFILAKDADAPQVMPGTGELFSARDALAGDLNPTDAWLMLTVNPDGAAGHTPDAFAGVWNHGGWNHDGWLN